MADYTRYFDNCKAVFQGGGCKAIAYVGAYKEAYKRGVFFSELSGTSAGSLFAAFIAAGAKPNYLEKIVMELDFRTFVKDYKKAGLFEKIIAKKKLPKEYRSYAKYLSFESLSDNFGVFKTDELYNFINDKLYELTGKRSLTFSDLTPDLHIVSADLHTHKVKTWNRSKTPEAKVAEAVCCSCAIPLFFQPVMNRYVDGGVLCNLPNFIFRDEPHYNKILCFRLTSAGKEVKINSFKDYALSLADTVVEGADNLHELLNLDTYDVSINVDDISSIDFDKLDETKKKQLIESGQKAAAAFFDNENIYSSDNNKKGNKRLTSYEQVYSLVSYLGYEKHKKVIVSCDSTYWSWCIFPTLVSWIRNGSTITVFVNKDLGKYPEQESSRRRMLKAMGCTLVEQERVQIEGFFFKSKEHWRGVSYRIANDTDAFFGKYYSDPLDGRMIGAWMNKLMEGVGEGKVPSISIRAVDEYDIKKALKAEPLYSDKNIDIRFKTIKVNEVVFMNPFIRALKYKQISTMFDLYMEKGLEPFSAAALIFANKKRSLIGPPVVEYHNGKYYVIEGNTRFAYAYRHGIERLKVVVVENVSAALPCNEDSVVTVDKVLLSDKKLQGIQRYGTFDYNLFRHIEERLHPYDTYMK